MRSRMMRTSMVALLLSATSLQISADAADAQTMPQNNVFSSTDATGGITNPYDIDNDPIAASNNGLQVMEWEGRAEEFASPGSQVSDTKSLGLNYNANTYSGKAANANHYCPNYDPTNPNNPDNTGCIQNEDNLIRFKAGGRENAFNTLSPLSGVTDALNAKAYTDQISNALTSPMAVLTSTINLTEPGIAAGVMGAFNVAGNAVAMRYQADNAIYNRQIANPSHGQFLVATYENCMNAAMSNSNGVTWIQAQSQCIGAERNSTIANGLNFDTVSGSGNSFTFKDDPNHPSNNNVTYNNGTVADNVIRALDYVFDQERGNPDPNAPSNNLASYDALRKSFEQLIGDVQFTLTLGGSSQQDPNNSGATNNGAYSVRVQKIDPTESPSEFYRNLVLARYQDIHAVLFMMCQYHNGNNGNFSGTGSNFWTGSPGVQQMLIHLSTRGVKMQPQVLLAIYSMFINERPQIANVINTRQDNSAGQYDCTYLNANKNGKADLTQYVKTPSDLGLMTNLRVRSAFTLAEKIAFGQYMEILAHAQDVIENLTGGTYDSLVKQYMMNLIYSTAGTKDIRAVEQSNDRQLLETVIPAVQGATNRQSNRTRSMLAQGAGDGNTMSPST